MVLAFVVAYVVRRRVLVSEAEVVYEFYSALPIAFEDVGRGIGVELVLSAYEVPHEVAPVHVVHLVVQEEQHIVAETWFLMA